MSVEASFRCPVCRASQTLRDTCRRCQADLSLVVRAHLRLSYVRREIEAAQACAGRDREQILMDELRWLTPSE